MFGLGTHAQLTFAQFVSFDPDPLSPVEASAANRMSAFNFCNPFDHVLPFADGSISNLDRAHLWGLYSGIAPSSGTIISQARASSRFVFSRVHGRVN